MAPLYAVGTYNVMISCSSLEVIKYFTSEDETVVCYIYLKSNMVKLWYIY